MSKVRELRECRALLREYMALFRNCVVARSDLLNCVQGERIQSPMFDYRVFLREYRALLRNYRTFLQRIDGFFEKV